MKCRVPEYLSVFCFLGRFPLVFRGVVLSSWPYFRVCDSVAVFLLTETSLHLCVYTWVFNTGFWAGRESSILEIWAVPAAQQIIPGGGGLRPPPFGMVFGASQTPNIDDLRPAKKNMYSKPKCI
jgi:hypothetical protein